MSMGWYGLDWSGLEYAPEEGWDEARILAIESNGRYRKYNDSAHIACSTKPISQPSLDISPIWIPLINNEVFNSQRRSVWRDRSPQGSTRFRPRVLRLYSTDGIIGGFQLTEKICMTWHISHRLRCRVFRMHSTDGTIGGYYLFPYKNYFFLCTFHCIGAHALSLVGYLYPPSFFPS
jgi:hypothetical protein